MLRIIANEVFLETTNGLTIFWSTVNEGELSNKELFFFNFSSCKGDYLTKPMENPENSRKGCSFSVEHAIYHMRLLHYSE